MTKLILEKGEGFQFTTKRTREGLENLFEKEFNDMGEIAIALAKIPGGGGIIYLPHEVPIRLSNLPYTVKEWPVYGPISNGLSSVIIAKVGVKSDSKVPLSTFHEAEYPRFNGRKVS